MSEYEPTETQECDDDELSTAKGHDSDVVKILIVKRSMFAAPPEMATFTYWYN